MKTHVMVACMSVLLPGAMACAGDEAADDVQATADLQSDEAETCTGMLFIDFPCLPSELHVCLGQNRYRRSETKGCADIGLDPRCCSGLTCVGLPQEACPDGTFCWHDTDGAGKCRDTECGRAGDPDCQADTACETSQGDCQATFGGYCRSRTGCEQPRFPYNPLEWVCGCDGVSYPDDCARLDAGVGLDYVGPCCDPSKRLIEQANPDDYEYWLICGKGDVGLVAARKFMAAGSRSSAPLGDCVQANVGETWGCEPGEWACRGALRVHQTAPGITDDHWNLLCQFTGLPGVRGVSGAMGPS